MEIVIIANASRQKKDQPIINEAENVFDKVTYAPIKKIRFDLVTARDKGLFEPVIRQEGAHIKYEGVDLSEADVILPIPIYLQAELFYTAFRMLDSATSIMPFNSSIYKLTMHPHLLVSFLGKNGIPIRRGLVVASNITLDRIDRSIQYPVIVRPPEKRIMVNNRQTLKDVLSLYKFGTPIRIETPIKSEQNVWMFVLGDEVIASYEHRGNSYKIVNVDKEAQDLAIKVRQLIGCDYLATRFLKSGEDWIFDQMTFAPDFANFEKITGVSIGRRMISYLFMKARKPERQTILKKVEEIFSFEKLERIFPTTPEGYESKNGGSNGHEDPKQSQDEKLNADEEGKREE